jgi:bifunctional DNA-binding transcriptional regulator/antitoxin component of YhaV-PrlF toxin-antitoxin module
MVHQYGHGFKAMMTENGRMVVPARLRKLLGIEGKRAEILFHVQDREVTLTTKMQALRRAQERLAGTAPTGTKLVSEELIEDRLAEALRESDDE